MNIPGFGEDSDDRPFLGVERSVGNRVWRDRLDAAGNARALAMSQQMGVGDVLARVLAGRGVAAEAVSDYLNPTLRGLMPDPSSLTDMDAAAARLASAIVVREPVAIFGDYDVDGATSTALLGRYLEAFGLKPATYIPDRLTEGYGPSPEAVRSLAGEGARLIVMVDCGTAGHDALSEARTLGVDVVVLDHHQTGPSLPPAAALVNPNRQDDLSGLGHLCAVGVTFLTLVAVNRVLRTKHGTAGPDLMQWLDLVALGTVCDVVPLTGLNRAYVVRGLEVMRQSANLGLKTLIGRSRLSGPLSPYHLGFVLGPRINAGGRIGNSGLGANLLGTGDEAEAERIAERLDLLNAERQAMEKAMLEEADAQVPIADEMEDEPACLMVSGESWHAGIVGLIAARLKERYRRPAVAVAFDANNTGSGSGRSIDGVDLGQAVRDAVEKGILEKGGGHAMAAGMTLDRARLDDFAQFLNETLAEPVARARTSRVLKIDAALQPGAATPEMAASIESAGPFGAGNPEPVFALPALRVRYAKVVGAGHVSLNLAADSGASVKAIAFRSADRPLGRALLDSEGAPLHIAGALTVDHWQGAARAQIRVIDAARPVR